MAIRTSYRKKPTTKTVSSNKPYRPKWFFHATERRRPHTIPTRNHWVVSMPAHNSILLILCMPIKNILLVGHARIRTFHTNILLLTAMLISPLCIHPSQQLRNVFLSPIDQYSFTISRCVPSTISVNNERILRGCFHTKTCDGYTIRCVSV